jgi:hypothetical protein
MISDIYKTRTAATNATEPIPPMSREMIRESEKKVPGSAYEKRIRELLNKVREDQSQRLPTMLAGHVRKAFEAAKTAKTSAGIDDLLDSCLRARKGKYDPQDLAKIREATPGGSELYMMLTNDKSRACEAILKNTLLPAGVEKPWGFDPSPVPELPEATRVEIQEQIIRESTEVMVADGYNYDAIDENQVKNRQAELQKKTMTENYKQAKVQTEILEKYVEDQLLEGNFYEELAKVINDISIFPTAFLKGPINRMAPAMKFDDNIQKHITINKLQRQYDRVSPYDAFPAPGAKNIHDGPFIQKHRLRLFKLQSLIGVDGYDDEAIRAVLLEYGQGGLREWLSGDTSREYAEGRPLAETDPDPQIDAIEYWGSVQGKALIDWGMSEDKIDKPEFAYHITAWLIGDWIIMARLNNHPLGHNPYFAASFSYNNDSIWGESPPMLMASEQKACNACARALFNRMAFASGPIMEIIWDRLAPGENPTNIRPWMLIKTRSDVNSPAQAVYLTEFNPFSNVFLEVYEYFAKQASETTGIPDYVSGGTDDAHKTSSGFAMQINNMNAMMRNVVMGIDDNIVKKVIYEHWLSVMLFDDDVPKIGDVAIRARASDYIIAQEQLQLRRNEFQESTANPYDMDIIGKRGRANMLRENAAGLKYDNDIVPSDDEMAMREDKDAMIQRLMMQIDQLTGGAGPETAGGNAGLRNVKKGALMDNAGGQKGNEPGRMMVNA